MESSASRQQQELQRQEVIRRQIAQLQAQLADPNAASYLSEDASGLDETKRKRLNANVLAPASPERKKRRISPTAPPQSANEAHNRHKGRAQPSQYDAGIHSETSGTVSQQQGPSNVLSRLSALSKRAPSPTAPDVSMRTSSFADKASTTTAPQAPARDSDLTLIEDLEPGPYEHKAPFDDPLFKCLEPHSGIRLASRTLPYDDLQEYMAGRHYISPSKLYSVVRTQPGVGARSQVFDVPVIGDWVTIAVVAERSPIRVSRAPVTFGQGEERDADDPDPAPATAAPPGKKLKPGNNDPPPRAGRKYVNLTLVDFGAGGKKGTSRGDAALSLLLFESDSFDTLSKGDGTLPTKIYKGGSRGAFETMAKLREGSVIALLNPRVLKPLQKPGAPNVLALTPESADSVALIGTARDLGMCSVVKRDGKACGSWCDKRVSDVCEYHVQHAVERRRAGRAEFSAGTSGMTAGSGSQKRKSAYDPQRKWGLAPAEGSTVPAAAEGATYVVAGHVVAGGKRDLFINETVGREAQARAARLAGGRDADDALKRLLARDKEGMKAVREARRFAKQAKAKAAAEGKSSGKAPSKGSHEADEDDSDSYLSGAEKDSDEPTARTDKPTKNAYSAEVIKRLGFDPTLKPGGRKRGSDAQGVHSKVCIGGARISLGPRPGARVRSVVSAPKAVQGRSPVGTEEKQALVDLEDEDDDLETFEREAFGKTLEGREMVDLDCSDDDFIVEAPAS
ncbi:hypothetical protein BC834DRAFT_922494 [Gloeopeniophorella convolvens]|nr:hypothetical protein BC834DRAFT_922494 [Gloeopeniophorella convolvens]